MRAVSAARQLATKQAVEVTLLETGAFRAEVAKRSSEAEEERAEGIRVSRSDAFALGFNFIPPPERRASLATSREVLESEIVGFYDVELAKVFVPAVAPEDEAQSREQKAVLAHEIEHALQAQHFGRLKSRSDDEALAQLALIEGDAMVAMGAYIGTDAGAPVGRTLRHITDVVRSVRLETMDSTRRAKPIDHATALTRQRLTFPYDEGMLFVTDLYRAGGFPLVNRAFAKPPTSTSQILHPEKYLAGVEPRQFIDLKVDADLAIVSTGTLGELQTRVVLASCLPQEDASTAAAGWEGDRYTVVVDKQHALGLAWAISFENEAEAKEAAAAFEKSKSCWAGNRLDDASDVVIGADFDVTRSGRVVSVARGLDAGRRKSWLQALPGTAAPPTQAVPLSTAKIPPRVELPKPRGGELHGDVYQNDWLGLVARVPRGMTAKVDADDDVAFMVERKDRVAFGGLAFSSRISNAEQDELTFKQVRRALTEALQRDSLLSLKLIQTGPFDTPLGRGTSRTWIVPETLLQVRMILVPVCAMTGSVVFLLVDGDPQSRAVMDGWLASVRWTNGRNLEACDYLDPK